MPDIGDIATYHAEQEEKLRKLQRERAKPPSGLPFIGSCHNCGESLLSPLRFCDADCRDDWEARERSRRQR